MDPARSKAKWQQPIAQEDENCEPIRLAEAFTAFSDLYAGILNDLRVQETLQKPTLISLERPYGYFLLWANGYGVADGSIEASLHKSERARQATFRILISISRSLTEKLLPALNIETQARFSAEASKLSQATNRLRSRIVQARLDNDPSETGAESDDDSVHEVEDLLEIAEDLRNDTQCLMDLGARFDEPALGGETTSNVHQDAALTACSPESLESPILGFSHESAVPTPISMFPSDQMAEQREWPLKEKDKGRLRDLQRTASCDNKKRDAFDNVGILPDSTTMPWNDGGNAEMRMLRRAGQLVDDSAQIVQSGSSDKMPSPPLLQKPLIRSQSTKDLNLSWISDSIVRRGSLTSATSPGSFDSSRQPNAPELRHDASRGTFFHTSQIPVVPNLTWQGGSADSSDRRRFRSGSPSYARALSTIRYVSPSMLSADTTAYTYDDLNKGEFRLIMIFPQRQDDTADIIRCELLSYMLSEPPDYIALSYTWGIGSKPRQILMQRSNMTMRVTANLESALRALRDPKRAILVWADALSIDQGNSSEKAEQVRLMTQIYQKAKSVAIWLGPQSDHSDLGMDLIEKVSNGAKMPLEITKGTPAPFSEYHFASVVALFDREYWHRLWVVQEVFNARSIKVHCGPATLPWKAFKTASKVFEENRDILERSFRSQYRSNPWRAPNGSDAQVLIHEGPGSLAGVGTPEKFRGDDKLSDQVVFSDLLEVMRTCRRRHCSDPRDKVFGVLGVLTEKIRNEIKVDYNISVKDVYVEIFRTVVEKTRSLDIMCDSIHQEYGNNNELPSWVPDWTQISWVSPIATTNAFSASRMAEVDVDFTEKNKLRIRAIPLGKIKEHGIALDTGCTVGDYLMAFLNWRACLSHCLDDLKDSEEYLQWLKRRFCLALSLDHTPEEYDTPEAWLDVCYHVFACTIRDRLPTLQMDHELEQYIGKDFQMDYNKRRLFMQEHFGSNMMGRCFCITDRMRLGLGTGFMARGDVVVVPLGCSAPVVLRPEGDGYIFVGDVYIDGYMYGEAVEECNKGYVDTQVRSYVIH